MLPLQLSDGMESAGVFVAQDLIRPEVWDQWCCWGSSTMLVNQGPSLSLSLRQGKVEVLAGCERAMGGQVMRRVLLSLLMLRLKWSMGTSNPLLTPVGRSAGQIPAKDFSGFTSGEVSVRDVTPRKRV